MIVRCPNIAHQLPKSASDRVCSLCGDNEIVHVFPAESNSEIVMLVRPPQTVTGIDWEKE